MKNVTLVVAHSVPQVHALMGMLDPPAQSAEEYNRQMVERESLPDVVYMLVENYQLVSFPWPEEWNVQCAAIYVVGAGGQTVRLRRPVPGIGNTPSKLVEGLKAAAVNEPERYKIPLYKYLALIERLDAVRAASPTSVRAIYTTLMQALAEGMMEDTADLTLLDALVRYGDDCYELLEPLVAAEEMALRGTCSTSRARLADHQYMRGRFVHNRKNKPVRRYSVHRKAGRVRGG